MSMSMPVHSGAAVEQLFFFASHGTATPADLRLLRHYALQLGGERLAAWVLLYRPDVDGMPILEAETRAVGAPVAAWGDATLARALPLVAAQRATHPGLLATRDPNHRRYWWFHCRCLYPSHLGAHTPPYATRTTGDTGGSTAGAYTPPI